MTKQFKFFLQILITFTIGIWLTWSSLAQASTQDFVVDNFNAKYTLDSSIPGGKLSVTETIDLNFSDNNHGIYRNLPKKYKKIDTKLKVTSVLRDGKPEKYSKSTNNDNLVLKIGNPDLTITGKHQYIINYEQVGIVNFDSQKPEFYWDINGDAWQQQFTKVSASVIIKNNSFDSAIVQNLVCYTGSRGSKDQQCFSEIKNGQANFATTSPLAAFQTLTIGVPLDNYGFSERQLSTLDKLKENVFFSIFSYIWPSIIIGIMLLIRWNKFGKDYKGSGITIPEYQPPKGLKPIQVGMLADYRVDNKDISATLIDLAVNGYLKIHEEESKFMFFKSRKYSLELIKTDFSQLKPFETELIDVLFVQKSIGEIIKMSDLAKDRLLQVKLSKIKTKVKTSLEDEFKFIEKGKYHFSKSEIFITLAVVILAIFQNIKINNGIIYVNIFINIGLFLLASAFMSRRSHGGVEVYEKIMGLKMYMDLAEKDRLKMLQSVERPYAEPTKTPKLFEKLLPFAVALGVEKSWAKQFDGILNTQPNWMTTNAATFSSVNIASSVGNATSSFASNFSTTSSSSSGGGSAGGGGGGGGGGGW